MGMTARRMGPPKYPSLNPNFPKVLIKSAACYQRAHQLLVQALHRDSWL